MNKRIAIVNDIGSLGGIEMMLLVLARELPRDRYTPVYLAPESGAMIEQMEALGVEVIRAPRPRWWSVSFYIGQRKVFNPLALLYDGWVTLRYIGALRRALRVGRIDLVHSSGMVSQICAGVAARSLGLPHVAQVQDIIGSRLIRRWYGALLGRLTDRIAAISTAVATADLPIAKTQIVPNVVDLDRWQGGHLTRAALSLSDTQFVIGMVGRLTPWKGQRVFLAAARALLESGGQADRCRFVLVGDDSIGSVAGYRAELEADAQRGVLRDRVQLLGRRADVLDVMALCDVLVHASLKPEPFGIVIVEAMAMGKPVIATAHGGPCDIIDHGVDGLLIAPNDPVALTAALRDLLNDPVRAAAMGEHARLTVHTRYAAHTMIDSFCAIYDDLLADQLVDHTDRMQ